MAQYHDDYQVSWQEGATLKEGQKDANALLADEIIGEPSVISHILSTMTLTPEVSQWVDFAQSKLTLTSFKDLDEAWQHLNHHLVMRSYLSGYQLTAADLLVWGALRASAMFQRNLKTKPEMLGEHLCRWYQHVNSLEFAQQLQQDAMEVAKRQNTKAQDQGSFDLGLKNVEYGKVVTRFPPEPSGYLHIGHAKAALLNDYIARSNGGKLVVRFDDTNPTKEKSEYEKAIIEDLGLLGIQGDVQSHTSDHFQVIYDYAITLIKKGLAYVDDTELEQMREERGKGIASKCRDLSVEENLERFQQMKEATEQGLKCCLRAKISVDNKNKTLRDPVIYRCNLTPHHRTGRQWNIYPTYDFCCPIVDSIEGVTHSLRSNEYRDRNAQYHWFFEPLGLRPVEIMDFSRMNFVYTLLSKRKLQWFVDNQHVMGWDDPRFPTVRGIRRRGMTVDALRQYVLMQGASQKTMLLEWDKIWAVNKKVVDPIAPRHTAVLKDKLVSVELRGGPEAPFVKEMPKHKKQPQMGTKKTVFSSQLFVEQADASGFEVGEEITLMDWGNAVVEDIQRNEDSSASSAVLRLHLEGDVKTTKKKITWLGQSAQDAEHPKEALLLDYDYLITKKKLEEDDSFEDWLTPTTEFVEQALVDHNVGDLPVGSVLQLERKGYFVVDKLEGQSEVGCVTLVRVPDGKASNMASKHKEDPNAVKKSKGGGNPWDKKAKKAKKADMDQALDLPAHDRVSSMYATQKVYGDVGLLDAGKITSMYATKKIY